MNASDILRAKQQQLLYQTYYKPQVFQSTTCSTVNTISSIIRFVSAGVNITSTSYTSCLTTVPTYSAPPTFISYEMAQKSQQGEYGCVARPAGETDWKRTESTFTYAQTTLLSTFTPSGPLLPSSVRISSTLVSTGPAPVICPLIQLQQGTAFSSHVVSCDVPASQSGSCCK